MHQSASSDGRTLCSPNVPTCTVVNMQSSHTTHVVTATSNDSGWDSTSLFRRCRSSWSPLCRRTTRICRRKGTRLAGWRERGLSGAR